MPSFDEIEDCIPDGDGCWSHDSGLTMVTAQWLHDFARAVAEKERNACADTCELLREALDYIDAYRKQVDAIGGNDGNV